MASCSRCYQEFIQILKEELLPAMGCTEPIAVAYAAAKARETLGALPERVLVEASGNIIKNVKSVVVPNTGGLKGLPAAAAAGVVAGDASAELQVLASLVLCMATAYMPRGAKRIETPENEKKRRDRLPGRPAKMGCGIKI